MLTTFHSASALIIICAGLFLSACGGGSSSPTPTPAEGPVTATPTAAPTSEPSATPTPTAAPTASPTPTTAPTASPTPTAAPTTTPSPTLAPTSTPTPTAAPTTTPTPVTISFSASQENFPSAERGFYGWAGNDFVTQFDAGTMQAGFNAGQRLVFAKVVLDNFRTSDLTDAWLASMNSSFAKVRAAGMKTTLLFSYDFSEGGNDASAAQIKRHLEQLKPVLAANADVIPFMRAGFIGAWGEWHSSKAGNSCGYNAGTTSCDVADANRLIIRDALYANIPSTTQIGFRYPPDLQKWYPAPTQQKRAGIHNDCFLAGPTDSGTYETDAARTYAKALTADAAFGGETCENAGTPVRNTCADILSEGAQYHVAWLNIDYAPSVINAWKTGGCFDQVSRSMGYRFQLDTLAHAAQIARGSTAEVTVNLRNVGWARIFNPRKVVVTLKHKLSGATITAAAGDLQSLASQANASSAVTINLTLPADAQTGDYDVYLSAPDVFSATASDARYAVRFANTDNPTLGQAWDGATGAFKSGTVMTLF